MKKLILFAFAAVFTLSVITTDKIQNAEKVEARTIPSTWSPESLVITIYREWAPDANCYHIFGFCKIIIVI